MYEDRHWFIMGVGLSFKHETIILQKDDSVNLHLYPKYILMWGWGLVIVKSSLANMLPHIMWNGQNLILLYHILNKLNMS